VAAYVVPAAGRTVEVSTVQTWVASRMADYAVPRYVRVVDTILRNRTGKVDKVGLRAALVAELEASGRRGSP
jgi:fatty-acyl-CoA synthase